jgi:hypothetical protein
MSCEVFSVTSYWKDTKFQYFEEDAEERDSRLKHFKFFFCGGDCPENHKYPNNYEPDSQLKPYNICVH